jgi:competence protein ComER
MKIGLIGMKRTGKILINSLLQAQTFLPTEVVICNPLSTKTDALFSQYPGIFVAQHYRELIEEVTCFFVCVGIDTYRPLLEEIEGIVQENQVMITLTGSMMIRDLEEWLPCKIGKVLPVVSNQSVLKTCLYATGSRMNDMEKLWLKQLLSTITHPLPVEEPTMLAASELAHFAPILITKCIHMLVETAVKNNHLDRELAISIINQVALKTMPPLDDEWYAMLEQQVLPSTETDELRNRFSNVLQAFFQQKQEEWNQQMETQHQYLEK